MYDIEDAFLALKLNIKEKENLDDQNDHNIINHINHMIDEDVNAVKYMIDEDIQVKSESKSSCIMKHK